jgi:hypothetical protein
MQLMVEGDKWEMYIPHDLAYGEHGSPPKIPGKSVLVFQMEILQIQGEKVGAVRERNKHYGEKVSAVRERNKHYGEKVSAVRGF